MYEEVVLRIYVGSLAKRKSLWSYMKNKCSDLGILETFWNKSGVEAALNHLNEFSLFCDSVDGNTIVLVRDNGKVKVKYIRELFEEGRDEVSLVDGGKARQVDGVEVYVTDEQGKGLWAKVQMCTERRSKQAQYVVEATRCGKLMITGGHSLYFKKEFCDEVRSVPIIEYEPGDKLVGYRFKHEFNNVEERVVEIKQHRNIVDKKVVFTKEFLEFVGLWLADGSYNGQLNPSTVYAAVMNDTGCSKVVESVASQWGRQVRLSHNGVDGGVGGVELVRCMRALGLVGYSHTKEIPWWVYELSEKGIASVLRGYFSGDGACKISYDSKLKSWGKSYDHKHTTVSVGSVSRKLIYGVYYLLQMLGISSILKEHDVKDRSGGYRSDTKQYGEIRIYDGSNLKLFYEKIGFVHSEKQRKLQQIIDSLGEATGIGIESREDELYFPVKSITYNGIVDWTVYDLVVPGIERFNANGLLSSNSGAHSLYNKYVKPLGSRFLSDFSWMKTSEVVNYLDGYIKWLNQNGNKLEVYVVLDVIGSAEKTWEMQKYMESQGVNPMPVYHYGDDIQWLIKYVDNYEYIGIGGIATYGDNMSFYEKVFRIIGQEQGRCKRKLHGFAATDYKSMERYPWHSVDSVSWTMYSAYGMALFPKGLENGKLVYKEPVVVKCSKVRSASSSSKFVEEFCKVVGETNVYNYLIDIGVIGKDVDIRNIYDVLNETDVRCKLNLYYYQELNKTLNQKCEWEIYQKKLRVFV